MQFAALSFDTVLDATLAAPGVTTRGHAVAPPLRWLPDPGLQFLLWSGGRVDVGPRGLVSPNLGRVPDNDAFPQVPPPRRRRHLSGADLEALAMLRAAGAVTLGDDFTPAELRRAWRQVARAWHPDVVAPAATGAVSVNRTFADLAAACRRLRRVTNAPTHS